MVKIEISADTAEEAAEAVRLLASDAVPVSDIAREMFRVIDDGLRLGPTVGSKATRGTCGDGV